MNVLHISSAQTWRGGERQIFCLANGLQEHGVRSWVMCPQDSALSQRLMYVGISTLPLVLGFLSTVSNALRLRRWCQIHQIDLIHAHDSHAHTLVYFAYRIGLISRPSIVTRRQSNPISPRSFRKYNYPQIERIVCVSQSVADTMSPMIEHQRRLVVVHSGVKMDQAIKNESPHKHITIGYVAAFTQEKNHSSFAKIARALLTHDENLRFLLVGDGPLLATMQEHMKDISDFVRFTGQVTDVNAEYAQMDILLHTSDREALGTAILDAMRYALPVVAQNVGGVGEVVSEGVSGYLYPMSDIHLAVEKMIALVEDSDLRAELGHNGQVALQRFSAELMVKGNLDIYQQVLATLTADKKS